MIGMNGWVPAGTNYYVAVSKDGGEKLDKLRKRPWNGGSWQLYDPFPHNPHKAAPRRY